MSPVSPEKLLYNITILFVIDRLSRIEADAGLLAAIPTSGYGYPGTGMYE